MLKKINSKDNRIYKDCRRLLQKKYRDKEGRYLVEGFNLLAEVPADLLEHVFLREGVLQELESAAGECPMSGARMNPDDHVHDGNPVRNLSTIMTLMKEAVCCELTAELFDSLTATVTSQGVIAAVKKRSYDMDRLKKICKGNIVVLDRLQDPGNIGTVIRTCEGAGFDACIVLKGTGDIYSPKTLRAGAGSVFRVPIIQVENNRDIRELADSLGKKLIVTSLDADDYYYEYDLPRGVALVIGNEGNGVSNELCQMADIKLRIPMDGKLESLNASVAAGILMYEIKRQNIMQAASRQ